MAGSIREVLQGGGSAPGIIKIPYKRKSIQIVIIYIDDQHVSDVELNTAVDKYKTST